MYCWTSLKCSRSFFMGWVREAVCVASYVPSGQATGRSTGSRKKARTSRDRLQIENALAATRCEFGARDISPFQHTFACEPPCAARLPESGPGKYQVNAGFKSGNPCVIMSVAVQEILPGVRIIFTEQFFATRLSVLLRTTKAAPDWQHSCYFGSGEACLDWTILDPTRG